MYRIDSASKTIAASPQAIYQAFIDPDKLVVWLPPEGMSAQIDCFEPKKGGRYRIVLTYETSEGTGGKTTETTDVSEGTFTELIPEAKITWSGHFDSADPSMMNEMLQTWYFEAVPDGTKVTIICENVPEGIRKEDHDSGLESSLHNLAAFLETLKK